MKLLKEIAIRLGNGDESPTDKGYMTGCPCCGGTNTNLHIWRTEAGDIRGKCSKGCKTRDVLTVVRDLESTLADASYGLSNDANRNLMGITEEQLFNKNIPKPRVLLDPFLREQNISMIFGEAGTGKSWLAYGAAIALTRKSPVGIKIGPWEVRRGCGVLFVDGELPEYDIRSNMDLLVKGMGARSERSETNQLRIFSSIAEGELRGIDHNLVDETFRNRISAHLDTDKQCKLLIFDNISSLTSGVDENSKTKWDPVNAWLLKLRGKGVSTLMIHHSNKSGTDSGTSSRRRNVQIVIRLDRGCEEADRVCAKVHFEKCRGLSPGQGKSFYLQLIGDEKSGLRLEQADD